MDRTAAALALIVLAGLAIGVFRSDQGPPPQTRNAAAALGGVLGGDADTTGYARVTGPRPFRFPADHGAHPDYRSEWWYFTGNVDTPDGRPFGVQLTFFRFALAPSMPSRRSEWATRQAWMAHFAVTDVQAQKHHAFQRLERGALGLAGATTHPVRIWLDDWRAVGGPDALFPLTLDARENGVAVHLTLRRGKPVVLQGDRGYSRKSAEPGNASYYYSYTRLRASGRVHVDGRDYPVRGSVWLDREWSTSALAEDQAGWDWFALQLDDGRDVMVYRLRRRGGGVDPASAGVVVGPDGAVTRLQAGDFTGVPLRYWRSPETGARYPVAWRLRLPRAGLDVTVHPRLDSQEMAFSPRYWEGAVTVSDAGGEGNVRGTGYLELTGY